MPAPDPRPPQDDKDRATGAPAPIEPAENPRNTPAPGDSGEGAQTALEVLKRRRQARALVHSLGDGA